MKKYVIYLLKKNIPFFAVMFAILLSSFLINASNIRNYHAYYIDGGQYRFMAGPNSGLATFVIPLVIVLIVAAFLANRYRYSIKSVDLFYQTGKGERAVRYANNLTLLTGTLVTYTVAFLLAIVFMIIKQAIMNGQESEIDNVKYIYMMFNFGYYFSAYFLALIVGTVNYFITYFLVTRSNTMKNSVITFVFGQTLLSVIFMTPIWYYDTVCLLTGNQIDFYTTGLYGTRCLSFIGPISYIIGRFEEPIVFGTFTDLKVFTPASTFNNDASYVLTIVCLSLYFVIGGLCIYRFVKEKESSGEIAGKPVGRDKLQMIIFHSVFGLGALWGGAVGGSLSSIGLLTIFSSITSVIMFAAFYYLMLGIVKKSFKLTKKDLVVYIPIVSFQLISSIVLMSLSLMCR